MLENIPDFEPVEITAGARLRWTKTLADFPASLWELKYYFRGAGTGFDATATADGEAHDITVAAATTAAMTAGQYYFEAWATNLSDANEKYLVDEGRVTVKRSFLAVSTATTIDDRTQAEIDLAAVRAALSGAAGLSVLEYTIGNRSLRRRSHAELLDLEKRLVARVAGERRRERVRQGGNFLQHVEMSFENPD